MTKPKKLRLGIESPSPSLHEEESRVAVLEATVRHYLPQFEALIKKAVAKAKVEAPVAILHQDAFAAGYDDDEYTLLGMAVKYAGLRGVNVQIIGKNHETF
jgi:hypothetical protein